MTRPIMLSVNIPFAGFYNSKWSDLVDHYESSWIEYHCNEVEDKGNLDYESSWPEALRLSEWDYQSMLTRCSEYGDAYARISQDYCEEFGRRASDGIGIPLGLKFEAITSPREYNFETDRIFADIPLKSVRALFAISKADGHEQLALQIKSRFTSRDGFISGYANRLSEWLARPISDWDHNELGTLLLACLDIKRVDFEEDIDWAIYYSLSENDYSYWESCVDWPAFERLRDEARDEKREEYLADNPDVDPQDIPAPPCPLTVDMFQGTQWAAPQ